MSRPSWSTSPAGRVGDRDDARADRVELGGGDRADVAEALDRDARLAQVHADALADRLGDVDDAQAGRLAAPRRAAEHDRLAGDDLEDRVAHHLRVRVHEPRHLALAGAHVRRRDVAVGPDDGDQLGGVAAREALELGRRCARSACSARRPSRRRRAGRAARTSTSSTSPARRTRRARRRRRSESRPSSGPSSACAARGSRSARAPRRSRGGPGSSRRASGAAAPAG